MKRSFLSLVIASALLATAPAAVFAQSAATTTTATPSTSQMELDNSQRVMTTLEKRRGEFS